MKQYKYWCQPFSADDDRLLRGQLRLAADYRRSLAHLENRRRFLLRAIVKLPKEERPPFYALIKEPHNAEARRLRSLIVKPPRDGELGLAWGTYLLVEDAMDQSQRTTKALGDVGTFAARDEGLVGIHIQGRKIDAMSLVGGEDPFIRIGAELRGKVRRRDGNLGAPRLRDLLIRVGSNGRQPIFAKLHILMHRPLPHANLSWVKLRCRKIGPSYRWEVGFTVDEVSTGQPHVDRAEAVGIDIGWRQTDHGVRIAYWQGSDGRSGELIIPQGVVDRDGKSDSLRAIRDRERNENVVRLLAFRENISAALSKGADGKWDGATSATSSDEVDPRAHWCEATTHMHAWTRMGRFIGLFRAWSNARFSGDEQAFEATAAWLKHERHLYSWEAFNRRRQSFQVKGRIDALVVALVKRYETVGLEQRGMVPELVKRDIEHDGEEKALQRNNAKKMHACSPALVRMTLERFALKYGAAYVEIDPAYTTIDCAECSWRREEIADWSALDIACPACGVVEDQDKTAARNLLKMALASATDATVEKSGKTKKKMSARRTRKRVIEEGASLPVGA